MQLLDLPFGPRKTFSAPPEKFSLEGWGIKLIQSYLDLDFRNDVRGGFIHNQVKFSRGPDLRCFPSFIYL